MITKNLEVKHKYESQKYQNTTNNVNLRIKLILYYVIYSITKKFILNFIKGMNSGRTRKYGKQ